MQTGEIGAVIARGVEPIHFSETTSGRECREVFEWACAHARRYGTPPSPQLLQQRWPRWHGEPSADPLEPLVDEFLDEVRRRLFQSKVLELAELGSDPANRRILDELMLDAARDIATVVPSASVARLSEMPLRVATYEDEKAKGIRPGLDSGIPLFDDVTHGYRPGKLVVLSGFSGWGKSSISSWILSNIVEQDARALMCSLEMTKEEILDRIDTTIMNFSSAALNRRDLPEHVVEHWRRVAGLYQRARGDLIVVDKLGGCTVDRIYAEINRYRPYVTVVDFIQRMGNSKRGAARWENLDSAVNELKTIALQTESVVIVCSQDNRTAAESGSTELTTGGSHAIYEAADIYIGMYQTDEMRALNQIELRLLKNRGGKRLAEIKLFWEADTMLFKPWEERGAAEFTK